jgi:hypothetical protein
MPWPVNDGQGITMSKKLSISESGARLPTGDVAARYGVTPRSIDRWRKDPELAFPKPIYIRDRKYWSVKELVNWERQRTSASAA